MRYEPVAVLMPLLQHCAIHQTHASDVLDNLTWQACRDILNATESGHLLQALQKAGFKGLESVILLSSQAFTFPSHPPLPPPLPAHSIAPSAASTPYPAIQKPRPKGEIHV